MKKNILNIIQFLPYFPPHKGGVESVGKEIGEYWINTSFGDCINIVTSSNQEENLEKNEKIIFKGKQIGYKENGVQVLVVPSWEIVNNFPCYKFSNKQKDLIFKYLEKYVKKNSNIVIITHTRFFLTSFIGGIFSKGSKSKWVHIEHGSDYVKLGSKFKSYISYLYDKIIGKWIFKRADKILAISEASKKFIIRDFVNRKIDVFYRGINIPDIVEGGENLKEKFPQKIIIGYVGRLYKWKNVESLIKAYEGLDDKYKIESSLVIVGDGEDYNYLKSISKDENIYFAGGKSFEEALDYQKQFDIHIHSSSPGGGLATTLLQAMYFGNLIVATPNEGANEVIIDGKNGFLLKSDSIEELKNGIEKSLENLDKKEVFAKENKKIIMEKFSRKNNIKILYNLIK